MGTRAVIAYTRGDGHWIGVWNHGSSHTQYLGATLLQRVSIFDGNLEQLCKQLIDGCREGWTDLSKGERSGEGGVWFGAVTDGRVTFVRGEYSGGFETTGLPDRVCTR